MKEIPMTKTTLNPDGLPMPRRNYSLVNIAQLGERYLSAARRHWTMTARSSEPRRKTPNPLILGRLNALSKPARYDQRCRCAKRLHHRRAQLATSTNPSSKFGIELPDQHDGAGAGLGAARAVTGDQCGCAHFLNRRVRCPDGPAILDVGII
jgi:hypothetical protein